MRAWPVWLALLVGAGIFTALSRPVAARHRTLHRAAGVPADCSWVERAVAAAATTHHTESGSLVPPEIWRPHLAPEATPALRAHGVDPFGHPFGPQPADRPVVLPTDTRRILESLPQKK